MAAGNRTPLDSQLIERGTIEETLIIHSKSFIVKYLYLSPGAKLKPQQYHTKKVVYHFEDDDQKIFFPGESTVLENTSDKVLKVLSVEYPA